MTSTYSITLNTPAYNKPIWFLRYTSLLAGIQLDSAQTKKLSVISMHYIATNGKHFVFRI